MTTTVIRNASVFDGERRWPRSSVVFRDGVITEVGESVEVPDGAEVFDAPGQTLLPGLIDAHTHLVSVEDLAQTLAFGVSTSLDMFSSPGLVAELKSAAASRDDVADLRSAGIGASAPGGHPNSEKVGDIYGGRPTLTGPEQAAGFVADRVTEGIDYLKIISEDNTCWGDTPLPDLTPETVAALVTAAHDHQLLAVAHATTQRAAREALAAGVDGLVHIFADGPPEPDFADQAVAAGVFVVPTLAVMEAYFTHGTPGTQRLAEDPRLAPHLGPSAQQTLTPLSTYGWRPPQPDLPRPEFARQATELLHRAGVPLLAGTDAPNPGTAHGLTL
ncbi:MAG: amidohydrolase family protein, partial [Kutzneria sp.]|nr:amidohydrolase family protein [Kutzneria sp.]